MHIFIKFYYSRIFILRLSSRFTQLKFIFFCRAAPWYIHVYLYTNIRHFGCTKVQPYMDNEYVSLIVKSHYNVKEYNKPYPSKKVCAGHTRRNKRCA